MILVRKLLDFVFTKRELKILDDILPKTTQPFSKTRNDNKGSYAPVNDMEKNGKGAADNVSFCFSFYYAKSHKIS